MLRRVAISLMVILVVTGAVLATGTLSPVAPRNAAKVMTGMEAINVPSVAPGHDYSPSLDDTIIGLRYQAGTTWYDYQHNGSAGKMIYPDSMNFVHVVWMNGLNSTFTQRHAYYNCWDPTTQTFLQQSGLQINSASRGGYACQVTAPNGFCYPAYHETSPADNLPHTASAIDFQPQSGSFIPSEPTFLSWPEGHSQLIWPKVAQSRDGKLHYVSTESAFNTDQVWQRQAYSRAIPVFDGEYGDHLQWENVDGTRQMWVFDTTTTIAPTIAAAHNSDRIAIAYTRCRYPYNALQGLLIEQVNNDLYLIESEDGGLNWGAPVNVTNFQAPDLNCASGDTLECNKDTLRVYDDTEVFFDDQDVLHVAFTTVTFYQLGYPEVGSGALLFRQQSGVWHWSEASNVFTPIYNDYDFYYNADTTAFLDEGAWQFNVQRPSLAQDPVTGYLYCSLWRYEGDQWSTGLYRMGDAYVSVSTNNGFSWSEAKNVTNTDGGQDTPAPGSKSERDITIAPRVTYSDGHGYLNMEYIFDHDAGAVIQTPPEGIATLNEVYFQRIPVDSIPTEPVLSPYWPALHVDSTGFPPFVAAGDPGAEMPQSLVLYQNYPNPFNPTTDIQFDLPRNMRVTLKVFNTLGQEVATLLDSRMMSAGAQVVPFDASSLASGVYIYRVDVDGASVSKKMVLMK